VSVKLKAVVLYCTSLQSQLRVRSPLHLDEIFECNGCLRATLTLIRPTHSVLEDRPCVLPTNRADWSKSFSTLNSCHQFVRLKHVFPPTKNPYLSAFASNYETAVLISRSSHSLLSAGSSASFCVADHSSAGVKPHGRLRADISPRRGFRPRGSANTSQVGSPAIVLKIVFECVRRPKTQEPATTWRLRGQSEVGFRLFLRLWPPYVRHCLGN